MVDSERLDKRRRPFDAAISGDCERAMFGHGPSHVVIDAAIDNERRARRKKSADRQKDGYGHENGWGFQGALPPQSRYAAILVRN